MTEMAQPVAGAESDVIRLPTDEWLAPHRRAPAWQAYGSTIWPFEFERSSEPPRYEVKLCSLPGLGIALSNSSASRVRRGSRFLVNDDLVLRVNLEGSRTLLQCGREAVVGAGEAVLSSGAEISAAVTTETRFVSFRVPFKPIKALVPDVEDRIARTIPRTTESLRLLIGYGEMLHDGATTATSQLQHLAVTHVRDLIALTLGATGDEAEIARLRGVRAARLREIKVDVEAHLGERRLSIAALAERHRLPVRYVQRLFEGDGATFTEFVLERRLACAYSRLSDARFVDRPIAAIAYEAGFANQAYFNRTFRARFAATPSDIRAQTQQES